MYREILGYWILDPGDVRSFEIYGNISMEFKANGELIYTLHSDIKDEIMIMTYQIKGGVLITDQLSSPHMEETKFVLTFDDKLELFFSGHRSIHIRKKST
ncbi:hypothetical protein [Pedobacter panaciterrae]|uniref:hypothetical protein n=1 Tax=Pedobacter panaciterrae TaxID=363849 RepID=UPI0025970708|nr:hypothetical protein [uncultured Pedobacter sp.]